MPDLFDVCDVDRRQDGGLLAAFRRRRRADGVRPHHGRGGARQARRHADAQTACDQLQQRPAPFRLQGVQPAFDQTGRLLPACALQRVNDLAQRRLAVGPVVGIGRPDQGDRLGQVAHIVVGPAEQHRIDPRLGGLADHGRLRCGECQVAGQRRQRPAPIRIGRRPEIIAQENQLRLARRSQRQSIKQFGETAQIGS